MNPAASYTPFQFNPISPLISQQFEEDFYAQHKKSLTMANYGSNISKKKKISKNFYIEMKK